MKLMYITNNAQVGRAAEYAGVDRIFIDLEMLGKEKRQAGRNTVISRHTPADVKHMREALSGKAELLVRVDPVNPRLKEEVDAVVAYGADVIMLPMFRTPAEVREFLDIVDGRCRTILLLEHIDAVKRLDEILSLEGIEEFHIGLNDLHISMNKKFMFETLVDGTVESIMTKVKARGLPIGFGGMSRLGDGMLSAELILSEHCRLGSSGVILSRGFAQGTEGMEETALRDFFAANVAQIRKKEEEFKKADQGLLDANRKKLAARIEEICGGQFKTA